VHLVSAGDGVTSERRAEVPRGKVAPADRTAAGEAIDATTDELAASGRAVVETISAQFAEPMQQIQDALVKPYAEIVEGFMRDRDAAAAAWSDMNDEGSVLIPDARAFELEALRDVASGVDTVAEHLVGVMTAQRTTAEAQKLAADQLVHVGELIQALNATITSGNRSNGRLAKVAIAIAVVATIVTTVLGAIQLIVQVART
jgi:hypothetical protein